MIKPNWVVDEYILDSASTVGDLKKAIIDSGAGLYVTKYVPFSDEQDYGNFTVDDCVILYGTHGFLNKCKIPFTPGAYGIGNNTTCSVYYSNLPTEWMLNSDYFMLPFYDVMCNTDKVFRMVESDEFFLRPNSGFKTFAGFVVDSQNFNFELNASLQLSSVTPETICLISKTKKLLGEYRFIIGNGEVIDGSQYRYNDILDIRHDWPEDCWELANKVAKLPWQLDTCYTADIAQTEEGPKVIELNSLSCAGTYAVDKEIFVNRINEIAIKEFKGEL